MPLNPHRHVHTIVRSKKEVAQGIVEFELADSVGWPLPPFTAGAHIDAHVPTVGPRQYSLCGDPLDRDVYRIAVLRSADGRGGSRTFCDRVGVGDLLLVSLPRNHFPLAAGASWHRFIAGGIGLTPFLPMVAHLGAAGGYHLHACARDAERLPYRERLAELVAAGRASLHLGGRDSVNGLDVRACLAEPREGEHVYCCGPVALMDAVAHAARNWPPGTVHFERFQAAAVPSSAKALDVELARSGRIVRVEAGQTIAAALLDAGVEIDVSCEAGVCGACKTRLVAGEPEHRDVVLKPAERATHIIPCVSGCRSDRLVLDL